MAGNSSYLEMELTPLIDVVFLLLVFFMMGSEFRRQERQLELNLPVSATSEAFRAESQPIHVLEITAVDLWFNQYSVDLTKLEERLRQEEFKPVRLRIDETVPWQRVASILEILKSNGFTNLLIEFKIAGRKPDQLQGLRGSSE